MTKQNKKPLRITFLVAAIDNGGGSRVVAHYAEGLMRLGHSVLVVSPAPKSYGRLNNLLNAVIPNMRDQSPNHCARLGVPVASLERYRAITASDVPDADVIIATWWETAIWLKNFPASKGKKVHFVQGYELGNSIKHEIDAALALPFPKITISKWLASILAGLDMPEPVIVPNGVDCELFTSRTRERLIRPTVGFVYTSDPLKGADIAFKAIEIAQRECPTLTAKVFGNSAPLSSFDTKKITYKVSPSQKELVEIYSSCTAWLFPSRQEGFGLPILEALACGTPVIACPSGAAPEILANGGGSLLNTFQPEEMAGAIVKYVNMPDTVWSSVSSQASDIAKRSSWDISVEKFERFLITC